MNDRVLGGVLSRDVLVAAGFAALFLVGLGRPELMDPDESRHAEIARTMLAEQHFLTPRLYGEAYYDKPVGFHWTVAASFALFGLSTTAARLPSALAALVTLATTAWWALRIRDATTRYLATLMLGTSYLFVALGRLANIDMLFTALLTAAIARLSVATGEPPDVRRSALPSYALVALATLVKGPVALVLAAPALAAAWLTTRELGAGWLVPWRGVATMVAIGAPWYVAAAYADPNYIRTFLETHNLARFAGTQSLGHQNPLTYYAVTLPLALMPWTPLIAAGGYTLLRRRRHPPSEVVLLAWLATVLVVFACAGTRLVTYLLPAFPPLAVLGASGLADLHLFGSIGERAQRQLVAWTALCGVAVSLVTGSAAVWSAASLPAGLSTFLGSAIALFAATAYLFTLKNRVRAGPGAAVALLAAGTFVAACGTYGPVADLLTAAKGYRHLAMDLLREMPPNSVVLSLARSPHALAFYAGRTIGRVSDIDAARAALATDRAILLLTKRKYADALTGDPRTTIETVWRNAQGTTLLANARASEEWRRREGVEPSADHDSRHHGFEDRSGHRTRSLSPSSDRTHP